jgi:3-deoxy-manno-octulosonate cytidylyltransferase (CMP-KDO synthetase)
MNIIAIVPARMASTRFPGKPLADIHGVPMVGHVALRTAMCPLLKATYIATCDEEIMAYAASKGIRAVMTADTHTRCSDRTAEALGYIEQAMGFTADIVVMVQGDEPMVTPGMIEAAVRPLMEEPDLQITNLMGDLADAAEFEDPAEVKVVTDLKGNALYFSREPVPSRKKGVALVPMRKQVCVIPFRREFLLKFNSLAETPLEIIESVDMLRILENGETVRMIPIKDRTMSVDTPTDLERVRAFMRDDPLRGQYQG